LSAAHNASYTVIIRILTPNNAAFSDHIQHNDVQQI